MASSIQLLRSTNPQERPFAGNLLEGQPAANLHSSEPGLFFKTTDGSVVKFGPAAITSDGSPPNSTPQGSTGNSVGELWLDKSVDPAVLKVYDGAQWVDAGSGGGGGGTGNFVRWIYTATGGETSLSGTSGGVLLDYTPGLEEVYVNGVLITRGVDYSAVNGTSITNLAPLTAGDIVTVFSMNPLETVQLPGQVTLLRWTILATAGQTVLSGIDSSSQQLTYTAGLEEVYINGAFLRRGTDYTATNGSTITISSPLTEDDEITVLAWSPFTATTLSITNSDVANDAAIASEKLEYAVPNGPAGAERNVQNKLSDFVSVKDFGAVGDGVTDDRAAIQAAVNYVTTNPPFSGTVYFPKGVYRVIGVANGHDPAVNWNTAILIPFADFGVNKNVTLDGGGSARILLDSANTFAIRASRVGTIIRGLKIESTTKDNTVGIGLVQENRAQTTQVVSQNFCQVLDCIITGFQEGLIIEPGPTVGASGSGAYYPIIHNCAFNLNCRAIWVKASIQDPTNRPTRGNIIAPRIERGHTGIDLEYATEFSIFGAHAQFLNGNYPSPFNPYSAGQESFLRIGTNTEYCNLFGGEAEACTYDIFNEAVNGSALYTSGFTLGGVNYQIGNLPIVDRTTHRVSRETTTNQQLSYTFQNNSFVRLVADYETSNTKNLVVETNSIPRFRWFNGTTTHYGSVGDIVMTSTGRLDVGNNIKFPSTQVPSTDANVLDDYREGTFLPRIEGSTVVGSATYSVQSGSFTKIGNLVTINLSLSWSGHTGTGLMRLANLPFTNGSVPAVGAFYASTLSLSPNAVFQGVIGSGNDYLQLSECLSGTSTDLDVLGSGSFSMSVAYQAA